MNKIVEVFKWICLITTTFLLVKFGQYVLGIVLCSIAFAVYFYTLFLWAKKACETPLPRPRYYFLWFFLSYLLITYLFSLFFYAATNLGGKIIDLNGEPIKSLWECFYYSVVTITTLGYGDLKPISTLTRCLSIIEVSFGVIFLAAVLTVVLAFRDTHSS